MTAEMMARALGDGPPSDRRRGGAEGPEGEAAGVSPRPAASPGTRHPHYQPRARVVLVTRSCFHFPAEHRRRIRTTNGLERVNQELKRRTRVVRIFPNPESCRRLAAALLKEYHEDWISGRRYLRTEPLFKAAAEPAEDDSVRPAA